MTCKPLLSIASVPRGKPLLSWCGAHLPVSVSQISFFLKKQKPKGALGYVDHVAQPTVPAPRTFLYQDTGQLSNVENFTFQGLKVSFHPP